ncbi:MAG: SsrA-binding protein SmpB [Desulfatibacillaceae bacterium]
MRNSFKSVAKNRKARHEYHIEDEMEAGMVLTGTEVKSLRMGKVNIKDSYARLANGELWLHQLHIGEYPFAYYNNHEPLRPRKLLVHKQELKKLFGKIKEKGYTLVPMELYFKNGKAKVRLALAKGKQKYDKRESIRKREEQRELDRARKKDQV